MKNTILKASLAVAMTLGLVAPAFAAVGDPITTPTDGVYGGTVAVAGELKAPTIKITVPSTGAVIINPLKMAVTIDSIEVQKGVISDTGFIKSESAVDLSVSLTATGTPTGGVILAAATPAATVTTKSVYMYAQLMEAVGSDADKATPDVPTWDDTFSAKTSTVVATAPKALKNAITLPKLSGSGSTDPGFVAYRLTGEATANPLQAWTPADKVDVALAFTFTPVVLTP